MVVVGVVDAGVAVVFVLVVVLPAVDMTLVFGLNLSGISGAGAVNVLLK